jgi:uncharacterized protein YaaQ
MKLIIAIVNDEFSNKVIRVLMKNKVRITKLSSTGGFLKAGNTTLLIGAEDENIEKVVGMIKNECKSTKVKEGDQELTVSGANLFIMDIDQYLKI